MRVRLFAIVAVASACASFGRSQPPRLGGAYTIRLAVTGRSTYTGSLTAEWARDSVSGAMTLTAPLSVDMPFRGAQTGDTLRIRGSYAASNGCTGTFEAAIGPASDVAGRGPFTLTDRCAGALPGIMELRR